MYQEEIQANRYKNWKVGFIMILRFSTKLLIIPIFLAASLLNACSEQSVGVARVIDGDTIITTSETTVRLLQIDSPENGKECYADEARNELLAILGEKASEKNQGNLDVPVFSRIKLEKDSASADIDKFGRDLAYVFIGDLNVNLELVKRGAAAPYFYDGEMGKYAKQLITAAEEAKAAGLGVWSACPDAILDPTKNFSSGLEKLVIDQNDLEAPLTPSSGANCDPNYEGCIPMYPPDLDCPDIRALGLAPVHRIAGDPHRLDRDGDGVGCEKP